ncbi:MAG: hypothetical protein FJ088_02990, partial [Deltaproteobacteria bacterium]|nr:hypothetical protein [Deltaproteobacteria bacterium]
MARSPFLLLFAVSTFLFSGCGSDNEKIEISLLEIPEREDALLMVENDYEDAEESGSEEGLADDETVDVSDNTIAKIKIDTAKIIKKNTTLALGSGIEIESNAQGLCAQMLTDRGFEYDKPVLDAKKWYPWILFSEEGVSAAMEWSDERSLQGSRSMKLVITGSTEGKGAVLVQGGMGFHKGRKYDFSFYALHDGNPPDIIVAAIMDVATEKIIAGPVSFQVDSTKEKWSFYAKEFMVVESSSNAALLMAFSGISHFWVDSVSLAPADAKHGIWSEYVALFKEAGISVARLGGISADGYDWGKGLGDRDRRDVSLSAFAGTFLDSENVLQYIPYYNDVGTHEFIGFCKEIGAEPLITVNFPLGEQAAANWVEYANIASPGQQYGKDKGWKPFSYKSTDKAPKGYFAWLREFHGQKEPWNVKYWEIGNELWDEELPEPGSLQGPQNLENYAQKAHDFAVAMKAVDPAIIVGAVGQPMPEPSIFDYRYQWNKKVLEKAGDAIDFLAPHYYGPGDFDKSQYGAETSFYLIAGIAPVFEHELETAQKAIDAWKSGGKSKDVHIAVTEYNIWHGVLEYQEEYAVNSMNALLGSAGLRNAVLRGPVWMGNIYNMISRPFGMIEWKKYPENPEKPLVMGGYLMQKLYADHFAPDIYETEVQAPLFSVKETIFASKLKDIPVLDAVAR